jgi:hypothetical protein
MDEAADLSAQVQDAGLGQAVLLYQVGLGALIKQMMCLRCLV